MIFTVFYFYASMLQWWRLRALGRKLDGTLHDQNALLMYAGASFHEYRKNRSLENLLLKTDNRTAVTVVPKLKLNLREWLALPKNNRYFPIHFYERYIEYGAPVIYVAVQARLNSYVKQQCPRSLLRLEYFGEIVAWKATEYFEAVVRTNIQGLAMLVNDFSNADIDINHELALMKIETVDVEGTPTQIKYEKKYLKCQCLKFSYLPVHWERFATELKDLYAKIRDVNKPKIKIENGSPNYMTGNMNITNINKVVKNLDKKNTLDVASGEHRRHKKTKAREAREGTSKTKQKAKSEEQKHKRPANKLVKQSSVKENEEVKAQDETQGTSGSSPKPPNVLVYADSLETKDNVKRVLFSILNKERYTIYDLPTSAKNTGWDKSTILVVVCGSVPPELTSYLIQYFLAGGKLLCLCSDLMYSVLYSFTTAEVREHELVRFTYGSWEGVKMMHHIFCYQASPAKKQFSKDSESNHSSNGSSPLAPRTPTNVELRHNEKDYNIQVQVLGTEETWQTPSLLLAKVKTSAGKAVFSQVHLEIDPAEYENDEEKYRSLLSSNDARLEILKDLLESQLDMSCDESFGKVQYTPGFFLGRYDAKMDVLSYVDNISNNTLTCDKISVVFCGHNVDPGAASSIRLPVLIHSCPSNFSTLDYFETLETEDIGRLVIYTDILTSSQYILQKLLKHGLVVIPRQQTNAMGRANNSWLSPLGSAAFSLQMTISLDSHLGKALTMIQHLIMVAVVSAIKNNGYESLGIGIKWPNDLYTLNGVKIGGLIVNSRMVTDYVYLVNIGCGVNLSNQNPTTCINELIDRTNKENDTALRPIPYEKYFAIVFNEIERLYRDVQKNGMKNLLDLYYKYWLHDNAVVTIQNECGKTMTAKVVGVDAYGFLCVLLDNGELTSVTPDGNTFDMMTGLIAPKKF